MPQSRRYTITELPGTLQRSCREAQETFLSALDDAVQIHGAGDQAPRLSVLSRKLHQGEEEVINLPDRFGEQIETHRLGDVRVGVQLVAGRDVRFCPGGAEYHHGDRQQVRFGFQFG